VCAVRAEDDRVGALQARDAADGVVLDLDERERTRGGIAAEDGERVVELTRDVDLLAIGADRRRTRRSAPSRLRCRSPGLR